MSNIRDEWETPQWLIDCLVDEYDIQMDLCATEYNHKLPLWSDDMFSITPEYLSLIKIGSAFMNPPYSNIGPFLEHAWELSKVSQIVCLVPDTITSCKYLDFLDRNRSSSPLRFLHRTYVTVVYFKRRVKYTHPTVKMSSPTFGSMLMIFDRRDF